MSNKSKSNFGGLKNSELVFIAFIMKDVLTSYQEIVKDQGVRTRITLPDGSFLESFKSLDDEDIEELVSSKRYGYVTDIYNKLNDVSTLIQESFPDIYDEIEDMFSQLE
jgi:hypothetical protein